MPPKLSTTATGSAPPAPPHHNQKPLPSDPSIHRAFSKLGASGGEKIGTTLGRGVGGILKAARPLPNAIDVEKFIAARAFEIFSFKRAQKLASSSTNTAQRAFQSLPRHLRRRAASHNPRRVPGRLRGKARFEIDSKDPTLKLQKKRALLRAKKGVRGRGVTEIFRGRQRNKIWLETHVWHAKRMKMVEKWGYRVASTPTQKSHRPSHRAAHNGCIIHDASYYCTIELNGALGELRGGFKGVVGGGRWGGGKYESGARLGKTTIHQYRQWPSGLIGPADVLWKPLEASRSQSQFTTQVQEAEEERTVWIRVHPSMFEEVWTALTEAIKGYYEQGSSAVAASASGSGGGRIRMKDLRGDLCAFEVMGPRAAGVLRGCLQLAGRVRRDKKDEVGGSEGMDVDMDEEEAMNEPGGRSVPISGGADEEGHGEVSEVVEGLADCKRKFWKGLKEVQSSGQLPEGMVVGLLVHDPRLSFPPKTDKHRAPPDGGTGIPPLLGPELASSLLWDEDLRSTLLKPTYRKADLDTRRTKTGIPGTKLIPTSSDDRIPIILIQRTVGHSSSGESIHGYTLLLPAGWAMPFWQSLVFTGSLIVGLQERETQYREAGVMPFPKAFPVTKAGRGEWKEAVEQLKFRWGRRPPSKRFGYGVAGKREPWEIEWRDLVPSTDGAAAGQAAEPLIVPEWACQGCGIASGKPILCDQARFAMVVQKIRLVLGLPRFEAETLERLWRSALLPVRIIPMGRGSPKDYAEIHLLSQKERDLKSTELTGDVQALPAPDASTHIGYVVDGNQSMARGTGFGIALVLMHRLAEGEGIVKVRNDTSLVWRYARLVAV